MGCQGELPRAPGDVAPADFSVRVVVGPAVPGGKPDIAIDFAGSSFGRGAWLHVRPACLERACRGGFARAFKRPVTASPAGIARQIVDAADQRIRGLLLGARRARLLAFGAEARDAVGRGDASLAIVASDAGSSGTKGPLLGAVHDGKVVAYATKAELGALFGREEVAVVAVTHEGVAEQIHCARAAADAVSALARE